MAQKYLITGGSGFLGINLIRYLLQKGEQVRSFDLAAFDYPEKDNIAAIHGDIRDQKTLTAAIKNMDIVVHCAAALPLYTKAEIFSTDVDGTRNVLAAARENNVKRVVFISSTAVYGVPDHHPIYENDRQIGVGPYGEAKIRAEKECLTARAAGMIVPILRPKSFIGPERLGVFALLYDWALDKRNFPILGNGQNRYQLLDVEDLCAAIYICATKDEKNVNDTFNIGAKEFTTLRADFQAVLDAAGFGKKIIAFPAAPAILLLKILEACKLSPIYQWIYETAGKDSFVDVTKAEKILGFTPKFSNQDALLRNLAWYKNNKNSFAGKHGISHRVPWDQGALKLLKFLF